MIIANVDMKKSILKIDNTIEFIDEDLLLDGLNIAYLHQFFGDDAGWFFQQFLKMAYSFICTREFYLSFDCDCLLIRDLKININKPFLNAMPIKIDINHPYFATIQKLLNIKIDSAHQYMCEFMIFNKNIMQDLCKVLNPRDSTLFYEPIIRLVSKNRDKYSFSEFETYANFALAYDVYDFTYIPVYRCGGRFYDKIPTLQDSLLRDFAKVYYLLQFNHWDKPVWFAKILHNKFLRKILGFKNLMRIYYYFGFYKKDFKNILMENNSEDK